MSIVQGRVHDSTPIHNILQWHQMVPCLKRLAVCFDKVGGGREVGGQAVKRCAEEMLNGPGTCCNEVCLFGGSWWVSRRKGKCWLFNGDLTLV